MNKAPKDTPILAKINPLAENCSNPDCCLHVQNTETLHASMCLYHGHAEGMSFVTSNYAVIMWGGAWEDSWEDGGGHMPDWWFLDDGYFETAANPVAWRLI